MKPNVSFSLLSGAVLMICCFAAAGRAQQVGTGEKPVSLNDAAVALDGSGTPALEARLVTTTLNGAPDMPVTNVRLVIRNVSTMVYGYVSGLVTFYDSSGIRCGEGTFKADVLATDESFETDAPGIRIHCAPRTWRIVATNLVPRTPPDSTVDTQTRTSATNLLLSVDGDEHPIQLGKPMVLKLGDRQRTLILRQAP